MVLTPGVTADRLWLCGGLTPRPGALEGILPARVCYTVSQKEETEPAGKFCRLSRPWRDRSGSIGATTCSSSLPVKGRLAVMNLKI